MGSAPHILILAAGKGTRMKSKLPKILHPVLYRPMIHYVLDLAHALPHQTVSMVVGHGDAQVREQCTPYASLKYFLQTQQRGTADAVRAAGDHLKSLSGRVLILSGDVILLRVETLQALLKQAQDNDTACTFATTQVATPKGYGRILRDKGSVKGIREEADCSEAERKLTEINAGIYCVDAQLLLSALAKISDRNRQKEFYLTDIIEVLASEKEKVEAFDVADAAETWGINDRAELSRAEGILQDRINREWMRQGVSLQSPSSIWIDPRTRFEADVRVEAGCVIVDCQVGEGSVIESGSRLVGCRLHSGVKIKQGSYLEKSEVGSGTSIGPYAHLRPGSDIGEECKIGNFVEVKKSKIGNGSKASHLSYIGDADVGKNVNIGCGFITCNFDGGPVKHRTVIEDEVFVGSDSQTVAPVKLGAGAYVASGSTITKNVPAGALAMTRVPQVNKEGYATRLKARQKKSSS